MFGVNDLQVSTGWWDALFGKAVIFIVYNRIPVMFAVVVLPVILSLGLFLIYLKKII